MYMKNFKDVVDALVNFDSVISSICECSIDKLTGVIRKFGIDNLNALYMKHYVTFECIHAKSHALGL